MKLFKLFMILLVIIILAIGILTVVTSRGVTQIIDLINKDTDTLNVEEGFDFSEPILNKYEINKTLFIPYMVKNTPKSNDEKYYTYSLKLASYKEKNNNKIVINYVIIDEMQDVYFNKVEKEINQEVAFDNNEIQSGDMILIDAINSYDMKLNKKSRIRIVINISVEENGKIITNDLKYDFQTRIREYLVQP
ncbi:hypothetical protein [Anaerovorax odorimutans]|uniref:hypothetical protein n=1 Tax=Anaerovorax odorimutans TaxID=109327 RepID=UPI000406F418|nr:hypothetical protein [Anaerovorax odorimutans]